MKNIDQKEQPFIQQEIQNLGQSPRSEKDQINLNSPYMQKYQQFFGKSHSQNISHIKQLLTPYKISYCQDGFSQEPAIIRQNATKSGKVMTISVSFSYFNFIINILNLKIEPLLYPFKLLGNGQFGSVYRNYSLDQSFFAIKKINYTDPYNSLNKVIIQYCHAKLCSALRIGPQIKTLWGYDLIVSKINAYFGMQICTKQKFTDQSTINLKQSLRLLHSFNITHGDIKPLNIMWSNKFSKFVFIDFGLASIFKNKLGLKNKTYYFGTLEYSSQEMVKLFQGKNEYIDVYFNDLYGLQKSINKYKKQIIVKNPKQDGTPDQKEKKIQYLNYIFNIRIQKFIFDKDFEQLQKFKEKHSQKQISSDTIEFLSQLTLNKKSKAFLQKIFNKKEIKVRYKQIQSPKEVESIEFFERMKQKFTKLSAQSYFVQITKFFSYQDISQKSKIRKQKLYGKLKKKLFTPQNQQYWKMFLQYISNLFTSTSQVLQMFEYVKKLIGIKDWIQIQPQINMKACQITEVVAQKYGFDLVIMNLQNQTQKMVQLKNQMIKTKLYERQPYATINSFKVNSNYTPGQDFQAHQKYEQQMMKLILQVYTQLSKQHQKNTQQVLQLFLLFLQNYFFSNRKILNRNSNSMESLMKKIKGDHICQKTRFFFDTMTKSRFNNTSGIICSPQNLRELFSIDQIFYNYCFDYEYMMSTYFLSNIFNKILCSHKSKQLQNTDDIVTKIVQWTKKYLFYRKGSIFFVNFFKYLKLLYDYCNIYIDQQGFYLILNTINQILVNFQQKISYIDIYEVYFIFPIREIFVPNNHRYQNYNKFFQDLMNNKLQYHFSPIETISLYSKYILNKIQRKATISEILKDFQQYQVNVLQIDNIYLTFHKLQLIYQLVLYCFRDQYQSQQLHMLITYTERINQFKNLLESENCHQLQLNSLGQQQKIRMTSIIINCLILLYLVVQEDTLKTLDLILKHKLKYVRQKEIQQTMYQFITILKIQKTRKKELSSIFQNIYQIIPVIRATYRQNPRLLSIKNTEIIFMMETFLNRYITNLLHQMKPQFKKAEAVYLAAFAQNLIRFCSLIKEYCEPFRLRFLNKKLSTVNRIRAQLLQTRSYLDRAIRCQYRIYKGFQPLYNQTQVLCRPKEKIYNINIDNLSLFLKNEQIKKKRIKNIGKINKIQEKIKNYRLNKIIPLQK